MSDQSLRGRLSRVVQRHNDSIAVLAFVIGMLIMLAVLAGLAPVEQSHNGRAQAQSSPFVLWTTDTASDHSSRPRYMSITSDTVYAATKSRVDIVDRKNGTVDGSTSNVNGAYTIGGLGTIGDAGYIITGDTWDVRAVRLTDGGGVIWENDTYMGEKAASVATDNSGNAFVGGEASGFGGNELVVAVDGNDETQLWQHSYHSSTIDRLEYNNGAIYSGGRDDKLVAADSVSGNKQWENTDATGDVRAIATGQDLVVYGGENGNIIWVNATTGNTIASDKSPNGNRLGGALSYDDATGLTYIGDPSTGDVWAYDRSEDSFAWNYTTSTTPLYEIEADAGRVYVSHEGGIDALVSNARVEGTVTDEDGQPVSGALVETPSGNTDQTDVNGEYSVTVDGQSGDFDITVSQEGFMNETATVTVNEPVETQDFTLTEARMDLKLTGYLKHGQSSDYVVTARTRNGKQNVTANTTVSSSNTSVITVDNSKEEIAATTNTAVNNRITVTAQWTDPDNVVRSDQQKVTVSNSTVDNLDILPPAWQLNAAVSDSSMQILLVAILLAVAATLFSSAFGGLSVGTIVIVIGWFGGYTDSGLVLAALATAAFIGLNLAANIDYSVRTG